MSEVQTTQLTQGWSWKQRNISVSSVLDELELSSQDSIQDGWTAAQAFPSEIHVELLKAALISDPYVGFNEHKVQCAYGSILLMMTLILDGFCEGIGEAEWLYKCSFPFTNPQSHPHALLEFEGLDTFCDVYLVSPHDGIQICPYQILM